MGTPDPKRKMEKLTDELFAAIETDQGHFYFSDGETNKTLEQYWSKLRGRLVHGEKAVAIMRAFLKKHGQLTESPSPAPPKKEKRS